MQQKCILYRELQSMDEEDYWQAVLNRDISFDGAFVYAVRSTGIYCRPGCAARQPRREQVVFLPGSEVAEQAGFRSCQRCCPRSARAPDPQAELVQCVCRYIEANVQNSLPLATLSKQVKRSPCYLQRTFKQIMGIAPGQYIEAHRLLQLKAQLKQGKAVTTALYETGYGSSSRLYERAVIHLGMTPATYRRGGAGICIGYTIVDSPLGHLLIAATERGLWPANLGDNEAELEAAFWNEYPASKIHRDDASLGQWARALLSYLSGWKLHLNLPLDIQTTAFQWQVWEELQAFPDSYTTHSVISKDQVDSFQFEPINCELKNSCYSS